MALHRFNLRMITYDLVRVRRADDRQRYAASQRQARINPNLTLTGYNSEYSDRLFTYKRDMKGGFAESPLRMNQGLGPLDSWTQETIRERAKTLASSSDRLVNAGVAADVTQDEIDHVTDYMRSQA